MSDDEPTLIFAPRTPVTLGDHLRTLRVERRKTMGDIARDLSLSVVQVSSIERGYERPTKKQFYDWCEVIGCERAETAHLMLLWRCFVPLQREHTIHTLHGDWATGDRASESVEEDCG